MGWKSAPGTGGVGYPRVTKEYFLVREGEGDEVEVQRVESPGLVATLKESGYREVSFEEFQAAAARTPFAIFVEEIAGELQALTDVLGKTYDVRERAGELASFFCQFCWWKELKVEFRLCTADEYDSHVEVFLEVASWSHKDVCDALLESIETYERARGDGTLSEYLEIEVTEEDQLVFRL